MQEGGEVLSILKRASGTGMPCMELVMLRV